jgi:peptide/nickel transport system permease protein
LRYFLARTVQAVCLMVGVSLLSFLFLELAPGDFFEEMRLNPQISSETVNSIRSHYGLDRPLPVRYWRWVQSSFRGELGFSFAYDSPVAPLLWVRARNTLLLASVALLGAWMLAIPLGVLTADRPSGIIARATSVLTSTLLATPDLLLALGILLISVRTRWFHVGGMVSADANSGPEWQGAVDVLHHLAPPVAVLVLVNLPVLLRHTTSAMRDALNSPFVEGARAQGIGHSRVLFRHALPAALNPLTSLFGSSLASLLSASLLVEVVMSWPGLGPLLLEAIMARDVYVVIGAVMLSTIFLVMGMLVGDILLFAADPRIRTERLA